MVIQTWHLLLILFLFVGGIFSLFLFLTKFKFKKAEMLTREMGFSFFTQKNIPAEYFGVSKYLRYFWGFEFLSYGTIVGKKIYFAQYLQKISSQLPYSYVVFSLFEKPYIFASDDERKHLQTQVESVIPGGLLTQDGIFYYHPIPWVLKKENILEISKGIVSAIQLLK